MISALLSSIRKPAVFLLVACLTAPGCGGDQAAAPPPPPSVAVATPVQEQIESYSLTTGVLEAIESVDIRARVPGFLERIEFEDSADVEVGQLMFVIERDSYQADRDAAFAEVKAAEVELERAELDLVRVEKAARTDAVSAQEVSTRRAERDKAKASLLRAEARLADAEVKLDYTQVRSPIAGRSGRHLVTVGNLVGSGDNTLLTTVVKMDPIYVYFDIAERAVVRHLRQSAGMDRDEALERAKVLISVGDETDYGHEGHFDFIDNVVDSATGTVRVRAILPNEDYLLYPGLFARVRVVAPEREDAVLVHEKAMGADLGGKYLLIVGEENVVSRSYVTIGALDGDMRAITDGIEPGDTYIVEGLLRARPGMPVTPHPYTPEPAQGASAR